MRVIVCGSRNWHNRERISERLADLPATATVVSGNARGADRIAEQEAQKLGLLVEVYPADWEHLGKAAGVLRNEQMAKGGADLCLAFWDGSSTGTVDMMTRARDHQIPVEVIV